MENENTQHTPGPYLVAYDETIKMWVVFYNQDRPDSLGERDFETGEQLSPIMCDQITVAQCTSKEIADLIASAPDLLKENEQLKSSLNKEIGNTAIQYNKLKKAEALNAELLEALKETSRYFVKRSGKGKMAKRVEALVNSAIAKAEGKTLGVS